MKRAQVSVWINGYGRRAFSKLAHWLAKNVNAGHVYVNGSKVSKAATKAYVGDDLRFVQGRVERIIRIEKLGDRRGPAPEAQTLYQDFTPAPEASEYIAPDHRSDKHSDRQGRPTKRARRAIDAMRRNGS